VDTISTAARGFSATDEGLKISHSAQNRYSCDYFWYLRVKTRVKRGDFAVFPQARVLI
jgi:hypothetical protein